MAENKMKEVAELLGLKLNQEFKIKGNLGNPYKFNEGGLCNKEGYCCPRAMTYLLIGKLEIEKQILDDVEKRYLEGVLRPFKDRIVYVEKICDITEVINEYIHVSLKYYDNAINDDFALPYFEEGTMYRGMELEKQYTLEELGLFNKGE